MRNGTGYFDGEFCPPVPVSFDLIEIRTTDRLAGVRVLLSVLGDAIAEYENRKLEELRALEQRTPEDATQYSGRRHILEHEAGFRLPRFAAYAVVTLLQTILEVHLRECATEVMAWKRLPFAPEDIKGSGILACATYLKKSGVYDVERDSAWPVLKDMRDVRNLMVHGAVTSSKRKQKTVNRLKQHLKQGFEYSGDWRQWNEIWISPELCQRFTDELEGFAGRCLSAVSALAPR